MDQDQQRHGYNQHQGAEELFGANIKMGRSGEGENDQVRKEDSVLIVLRPERTPVKEVVIGTSDHGHVVPLVTHHHIHGIVPEHPEIADYWCSEAENGESVNQSRVEPIYQSDTSDDVFGAAVKKFPQCPSCRFQVYSDLRI